MKIGYDISQTAENMTGCGYFSKEIISHLLEIDKENEYLLYPVFYGYRHPNYKNSFFSQQHNVRVLFHELSWEKLNKLWDQKIKDRDRLLNYPDLVHSFNFSCPKDVRAKKIVTIHDTAYLDHPEYTTESNRLVCFDGAFESSIYADHIVTNSLFTKTSFLKYFPHYPEERVSVVQLGTRPSLNNSLTETQVVNIKKKLGIDDPHWLAVGTIEPRKNYQLLLKAYSILVHDFGEKKDLIIVGGKGWLENNIYDKVEELRINNKVRFMGYVTDEELSVLYSSCFAFVYPSHYEGFGLPVLEAMNFGTAVITSNVTSLPEVIGHAGLLINPADHETLVEAMQALNMQPELRETLKNKAYERAKQFSWKKSAQQILQIYNKVMYQDPWFNLNSRY